MTDITPPIKRVSKEEMRRLFNEGNYYQRALDGEFRMSLLKVAILAFRRRINRCTHSQIISFRDSNNDEIARAH